MLTPTVTHTGQTRGDSGKVFAPPIDASDVVLKSDYTGYSILADALVAGTPAAVTIAEERLVGRITAGAITALTAAEVRTLLSLVIGTDVLAEQTIGIADDNLIEMDDADAADNDYAKFTANGLEGRSYAEVVADIGAAVLAGLAGGQTLKGGTAASEDLTLESTAHGTKGQVISADNHKFVKGASYDALYDNGNVSGNITIDWGANGNVQKMTLTGNVTAVAFTNPSGPGNYKLWIHQDGTGGRTVANWDADADWGGDEPVVSDGASKIDLAVFEYNGGSIYLAALLQGIDGAGFG